MLEALNEMNGGAVAQPIDPAEPSASGRNRRLMLEALNEMSGGTTEKLPSYPNSSTNVLDLTQPTPLNEIDFNSANLPPQTQPAMQSGTGELMSGVAPVNAPVMEQRPMDIRNPFADTGRYIDPTAPVDKLILKGLMSGDENTKIKNYKEIFGESFKEVKKDPSGSPMITLSKDGKEETFYVNRPNETIQDWIQDTPEFVMNSAIFILGSKGLGALANTKYVAPVTNVVSKVPGLGFMASKTPTILGEGAKAATTEFAKETVASGDPVKATYDAGVEGAMNIAMDSVLKAGGQVPYYATKLPVVGEKLGQLRSNIGKMIFGIGGDKEFAKNISALPNNQSTKKIVQKLVKSQDEESKVNDLAREIIRDMPIGDAEKAKLAKEALGERAELIVGAEIRTTLNKQIKTFKEQFLVSLEDSQGLISDTALAEKIMKMDPLEFVSSAEGKVFINNIDPDFNAEHILNLTNDYMASPSPWKIKPSQIGLGDYGDAWSRGEIGFPNHLQPYLHSMTLKTKPQTLEEYINNYNKFSNEVGQRVYNDPTISREEKDKILAEVNQLDINKYFKATDAKQASIKDIINKSSMVSGALGSAIGGFSGGFNPTGLAYGAVTGGAVKLIGDMVTRNPEVTIDAIKNLSRIQRAIIKDNKLVSAITPEQMITAKRFLSTKDAMDFAKYLTQSIRRNSELQETWRQKGTQAEQQETTPTDAPLNEKLPQENSGDFIMRRKAELLKK